MNIREDRPRKGYDQHGRYWLEQEPYLSSYQLEHVGDAINEDLLPMMCEPDLPPAIQFHDSPTLLRSIHAPFVISYKPLARNPRNPHRDRSGAERRFHFRRKSPGGRGRRGADGTGRATERRLPGDDPLQGAGPQGEQGEG